MPRIFEHHKTVLKMPVVERAIIIGENVHHEIINKEHNFVITSWDETLQSMGYTELNPFLENLKALHFKEAVANA